jgi:hypothetical protein
MMLALKICQKIKVVQEDIAVLAVRIKILLSDKTFKQ